MAGRTVTGNGIWWVMAAVIAVVAVVVGLVIALDRPERGEFGADGVPVGTSGADAVEVVVHEDPQCPFCARFKVEAGDDLDRLADDEGYELSYLVHTFLDDQASSDTSLRASAAALCAHDEGLFEDYREVMYANHRAFVPDGPAWTDDVLAGFGEQVGASDRFRSCVLRGDRVDDARDLSAVAEEVGVDFVPIVYVDGTPLTREDMERLWSGQADVVELVEEAAGR